MLGQLLKGLMPKAKITIESAKGEEPMEILATEYILVARTPEGGIAMGAGDSSFMKGAAIRVLSQAIKAEEKAIDKAVSVTRTKDEKCDCSKCDAAKICPGANLSKQITNG